MRIFIAALVSFLFVFQSQAQLPYDVKAIPQELLPGASAVIRTMDLSIDVKSLSQVNYRYKRVITVLNENGDEDARVFIWYNKSRSIRSIKGAVYDQHGIQTAKLSEKNFSDVSAANNSSLFEDSRLKIFRPAIPTYPYTLEIEYEVRSRQSLNFPDWYPNGSAGVAVEHATLTFQSAPDFKIRFKETNYKGKVESHSDEKVKTYRWAATNIKAIRNEPYSPLPEHFLTSVKIAPENFSYQGIKGSFSNWEEYGKWIYEALLKDRRELPEGTVQTVKRLTSDIADPREKAKKIYEYMQQKTRYVSIQVGIGGYQPFLASDVDRASYGDCKALVNYTQALLDVAGIESYYVVVASGDKKQDAIPDFASMNQFDHAILCIPFETDTVWADCTSKVNPFGYLGTFTDDRLAVACTPEGGKLMRTPRYAELNSRQIRKATFKVDAQGTVEGSMETIFDGWQYDNRDFLIGEPLSEQLKKLPEVYRIENLDVQSFKIDQHFEDQPITAENLVFKARNYGALSSNLMYVPVNRINQSPTPPEVRSRTNELYINRGYIDTDSIRYELPDGFDIETLPKPVFLVHPFGHFKMNVTVEDNSVAYYREIVLLQGNYPSEQYADLVSFYRKIDRADGERLVLKKRLL